MWLSRATEVFRKAAEVFSKASDVTTCQEMGLFLASPANSWGVDVKFIGTWNTQL
jgi:hypothetical protein